MRFDDRDDNDQERVALEREAAWRDLDPPQVEWDESEVSEIVDSYVAGNRYAE